ncbi:hypothetical protein LEP1GSC170_4222 [Leptospira interrogans serovar Bataviae str. HAI135]|nr:hypothetical protein LEP1GSC170_4222 [Leptospira interrogans serovar Bataviae str. HAI135]
MECKIWYFMKLNLKAIRKNSMHRFYGRSGKLNASLLWSLWETQCIASMVALGNSMHRFYGRSGKLNASLLWSLWETQCIASMVALGNSMHRFYGRSAGRCFKF